MGKKRIGLGFERTNGIYSTPNPSEPSGFDLKLDLEAVN